MNTFQQIFSGILRFTPFKKDEGLKSNQKGVFPLVGFLTSTKKADMEKAFGVKIHRPEYFEQALMHRSYLQVLPHDNLFSNERLEFLGDAVLGLIVGEYLFSLHTNVLEGELTKMRSWLVNKKSLAIAARKLQLENHVMLSFSALKSLERGSDSILADALEAIIAAIYLDSGLEVARKFVINAIMPIMMDKTVMVDTNFKSILLEKVQAQGKHAPRYVVLDEAGPDHDKEFVVGVYIDGTLLGTGRGKSKKGAEQTAAENAINELKNNNIKFDELDDNGKVNN